jgi:hypothetical protein
MKHALRIAGPLSFVCVAPLVAAPRHAQQPSEAQQDIRKSAENHWPLEVKGDLKGFISYFDVSYVGWSYDKPGAVGRRLTLDAS